MLKDLIEHPLKFKDTAISTSFYKLLLKKLYVFYDVYVSESN